MGWVGYTPGKDAKGKVIMVYRWTAEGAKTKSGISPGDIVQQEDLDSLSQQYLKAWVQNGEWTAEGVGKYESVQWEGDAAANKIGVGKKLNDVHWKKVQGDALAEICKEVPDDTGKKVLKLPPIQHTQKVRSHYIIPPIPKISYPGEEQAMHACVNLKIEAMNDGKLSRGWCGPLCAPKKMKASWWPWGAGMFATSLGPHDACFVVAANENPHSGYMVNWWYPAAIQKEIIETTKVDEMKDNCIGILIWHFVHHTPVNCWGRGPCVPCQCNPYC